MMRHLRSTIVNMLLLAGAAILGAAIGLAIGALVTRL